MADNYLENKMEEHRRNSGVGRQGSSLQRRHPLAYSLPERRIFVAGKVTPFMEQMLTTLAYDGMRIALYPGCENTEAGESLRRNAGVRLFFQMPDICRLAYDWRGIDCLVFSGESNVIIKDSFIGALSQATCNIRQDMPVVSVVEQCGRLDIVTGTIAGTPAAAGEIRSEAEVCQSNIIKLIKWIMSPENSCMLGAKFSFYQGKDISK